MSATMNGRTIKVGSYGYKYMGASEVCMHMRIVGKPFKFRLISERSVQLYREDGTEFSGPITTGEAGVFSEHDDDGWRFYYYPNEFNLNLPDLFNHELNLNNAEKPPVE